MPTTNSYEAWRVEQVKKQLRLNPYVEQPTHRYLINTLEALHLPSVASWYWQNLGLTPDDLDNPLAFATPGPS